MSSTLGLNQIAEHLLSEGAKHPDIDMMDVVVFNSHGHAITYRNRILENYMVQNEFSVSARVFSKGKVAMVAENSRQFKPETMINKALQMAKLLPVDPNAGLHKNFTTNIQEYDSFDPLSKDIASLKLDDYLKEFEQNCYANSGITNIESLGMSAGCNSYVIANSLGFFSQSSSSIFNVGGTLIAGSGQNMQAFGDSFSCTHYEDLPPAKLFAEKMARDTCHKLNPRILPGGSIPVIIHAQAAGDLVYELFICMNGYNILSKTSIFQDKLGQKIANSGFNLCDDPHQRRGMRSSSFDHEGYQTSRQMMIEDGILRQFFLDYKTSHALKMAPSGHARRAADGLPKASFSNLTLLPSSIPLANILSDFKQCYLVTELMGDGFNETTGQYSMGSSGFLVENGQIQYPVHNVTIGGNLLQMLSNAQCSQELKWGGNIVAPSIFVGNMSIGSNK